jgi:ubiquinone/menaquinone biosynthesis C-methylase UbiE
MKRPVFIARQSARPAGLIGAVIGRIMALETAKVNERAVDLLAPSRSDRVLEIGFGHGRTIERLAFAVGDGRVCGVDVSEAMLAMARNRNRRGVAEGRIDLRIADCAALPFADASFDGALSVHTLYFWSDPVSRLSEIRRVLRPGGRFVLGFLRAESDLCAGFPREVYSFYGEREVQAMLAEAGFESAQFTRVGEASLALAATPAD